MITGLARITLLLLAIASPLFAREPGHEHVPLDDLFANPPEESKPWCYWYWMNNNISKDGVTKDLEAMHKAGIKLAMIGNIEGGEGVKMFSPEWYEITRHALSEAHRLSLQIMMFNGPGWTQSGGPWIKPEQSMRRVAWNEVPAKGGDFSARVRPQNADASQDIAVLAVPRKPTVVIDGVKKDGALRFSHDSAFTARSLMVTGKGHGELFAFKEGGRELVARIDATGGNPRTDFLATEAEVFGFPDVTAREFELVGGFEGGVALGAEPKVAQYAEKQMGRMHPTPSPTWESYQFPDSVEPGDTSTLIRSGEIIDLTDKLAADGTLHCTLPEGEWTVIHFGMVPTGAKNGPAPPEATGLECDKMSKAHTKHHFDSMFGKLLKEVTPEEKAAWVGITIDSYEVGAQNWTDGFAGEFAKRNGYDPVLLLPVMTGRMIDSAKASDQFLWDLRRTVADMIAENYVAGLREEANKNGMRLWCENYGHWGFPGEFTIYGGHSDEVAGEFWFQHRQNLGNIECRAASSTAHIYGKRRVFADTSFPALCKARRLDGDGMIFFLSNFKSTGTFEATLRVTGMAPELFDPVSGKITKLARYRSVANGTRVTLDIKDPSDSFFLKTLSVGCHPGLETGNQPHPGSGHFHQRGQTGVWPDDPPGFPAGDRGIRIIISKVIMSERPWARRLSSF